MGIIVRSEKKRAVTQREHNYLGKEMDVRADGTGNDQNHRLGRTEDSLNCPVADVKNSVPGTG